MQKNGLMSVLSGQAMRSLREMAAQARFRLTYSIGLSDDHTGKLPVLRTRRRYKMFLMLISARRGPRRKGPSVTSNRGGSGRLSLAFPTMFHGNVREARKMPSARGRLAQAIDKFSNVLASLNSRWGLGTSDGSVTFFTNRGDNYSRPSFGMTNYQRPVSGQLVPWAEKSGQEKGTGAAVLGPGTDRTVPKVGGQISVLASAEGTTEDPADSEFHMTKDGVTLDRRDQCFGGRILGRTIRF